MDQLEVILQRIHKLLALAASTDKPGEAEAAQAAVQRLITRYQIDELTISASNKSASNDITGKMISIDKNVSMRSILLHYIAKHNFCRVLKGKSCAVIYGEPNDIELCIALFNLVDLHMLTEHNAKLAIAMSESTGEFVRHRWSDSFYAGYVLAIDERLRESKESTVSAMSSTNTSIVLAFKDKEHAIEEYYQKISPVRNPSKSFDTRDNAFIAGHASGRNADIGQTRIAE